MPKPTAILLYPLLSVALLGCSDDDLGGPGDTLAATGLYADIGADLVAEGVLAYQPRYGSWSDGATKRRWLALPPGGIIDTADPDEWVFPDGTRVWKEFTRDGARIETRLLEKRGAGDWRMVAYAWNAEQTDAFPVPDGVRDALGTGHDIPEVSQCAECHDGMADVLIGVSALQLDHDLEGLTTTTLADAGSLSEAPSARLEIPGDATAQAALGYLHANCGNCHNDRNQYLPLRLWLAAAALQDVEATGTYTTSVGVTTSTDPLSGVDATQIIVPGDPSRSLLHLRMSRRGNGGMPRLGTELVDPDGTAAIAAWIESL